MYDAASQQLSRARGIADAAQRDVLRWGSRAKCRSFADRQHADLGGTAEEHTLPDGVLRRSGRPSFASSPRLLRVNVSFCIVYSVYALYLTHGTVTLIFYDPSLGQRYIICNITNITNSTIP